MAFDFSKVLNSAKKAAKSVGDKTSSTAKSVNIKSKISKEKAEIEKVKTQIGQLVWDKFENGEIVSDDFTELCEAIRDRFAVITEFENEIASLKEKKEEVQEEVAEAIDEVEEVVAETFSEETESTEE